VFVLDAYLVPSETLIVRLVSHLWSKCLLANVGLGRKKCASKFVLHIENFSNQENMVYITFFDNISEAYKQEDLKILTIKLSRINFI